MSYTPDQIRDISVQVYMDRLGKDDTKRMLEKDADAGKKLRGRAAAYDPVTRSYLRALGLEPAL